MTSFSSIITNQWCTHHINSHGGCTTAEATYEPPIIGESAGRFGSVTNVDLYKMFPNFNLFLISVSDETEIRKEN